MPRQPWGLSCPRSTKPDFAEFGRSCSAFWSCAVFLNLMDLLVPHLHKLSGLQEEEHRNNQNINHVFLFVLAIAIHNLPEGMAAGVSFGGENTGHALSVAFGIMLQNVPEGMVMISPMLLAGVSRTRTFLIALTTSLIEVAGTFIGYAAGTASELLLPFALSFAGRRDALRHLRRNDTRHPRARL